jgi:regulator of replication initiation timing
LSHEVGYLKPAKLLLVDLVVTKSVLDRALDFANHLFLKLEDRGFRVVIAPNSEPFGRASVDEHEVPGGHRWHDNLWSPCRCTVVYVGTVAIGLTIVEISEEAKARYVDGEYVRESDCPPLKAGVAARGDSWTSTKDFPSGRLFLQAYSPYRGTHWVRHWRETNKRDLYKQVKTIIRELERAAVDISVLVEEAQRQAELERQRMKEQLEKWRREEENRKAIQARKDSREELVQIIEAWVHANHVEVFFRDAESQAAKLGEGERQRILERVRLARDLIGSVDALDHFLQWKSPNER